MTTNTTQTFIPSIVFIEDNAGDALILGETLRARGHAVELLVIEHGDKALHYFEIKASVHDVPPPHCILLDSRVPIVTGVQLLRFIRGSKVYDDTPVYIFAPQSEYTELFQSNLVSKESFLTKPTTWEGFLNLSDLLMLSATAKQEKSPATQTDLKPEVHAEGDLRRHDTKQERDRAESGPIGEKPQPGPVGVRR